MGRSSQRDSVPFLRTPRGVRGCRGMKFPCFPPLGGMGGEIKTRSLHFVYSFTVHWTRNDQRGRNNVTGESPRRKTSNKLQFIQGLGNLFGRGWKAHKTQSTSNPPTIRNLTPPSPVPHTPPQRHKPPDPITPGTHAPNPGRPHRKGLPG
jgi:hypothetical protein